MLVSLVYHLFFPCCLTYDMFFNLKFFQEKREVISCILSYLVVLYLVNNGVIFKYFNVNLPT